MQFAFQMDSQKSHSLQTNFQKEKQPIAEVGKSDEHESLQSQERQVPSLDSEKERRMYTLYGADIPGEFM